VGRYGEYYVPEWISNHKKSDVDFVCVFEDVVTGRLDHFTVGYDDFSAIEGFLLPWQLASPPLMYAMPRPTHKHLLLHEQHGCVRLEIDAIGLFHNVQTLDGDVPFVGQAETHEVQHCCLQENARDWQ